MKDYEPSTPRAVLTLVAVAMTIITMGALVVLPAKFDSAGTEPSTQVATKAATGAAIEGAASSGHVDAPPANRAVQGNPNRTTLGAQALSGGNQPLRSRARANF